MKRPDTTPLAPEDVADCARLHREAFPRFFLSTLGEPFLREFYRAFLGGHAVAWVARSSDDRELLGVVVGHTEPAGFFRSLLLRRWYAFALASLRLVLRRPLVIPRLMRALTYRGDAPMEFSGALLSSICVAASTRGLGIDGQLLERWTADLESRGVHSAHLSTDAQDNTATNAFYRARGWMLAMSYETHEGREMNCYTWTPQAGTGRLQ